MALSADGVAWLAQGLISADRTFVLPAWQVRMLQGPYVYHVTRKDHEGRSGRGYWDLYVGVKTGRGERPFDPEHHVLGHGMRWEDGDEVNIYPMPTPEVARWAEKVYIHIMRPGPILNKQHPTVEGVPDLTPADDLWADEVYAYA